MSSNGSLSPEGPLDSEELLRPQPSKLSSGEQEKQRVCWCERIYKLMTDSAKRCYRRLKLVVVVLVFILGGIYVYLTPLLAVAGGPRPVVPGGHVALTSESETGEALGNSREVSKEVRNGKKIVLLVSSHGRSGSTFLGEILSSTMGAVYFFEPGFFVSKKKTGCEGQDCYSQLLREIFTCSFSESTATMFRRKLGFFQFFSKNARVCRRLSGGKEKKKCADQIDVVKVCKEAPVIIVKTIRVRLPWIEKDLPTFPEELKVINLIRDPRATRNSLSKLPWSKNVTKSCTDIQGDLDAYSRMVVRFPGRVARVNYERLCAGIETETKRLFSFLGYEDIPLSTQEYLGQHTTHNGKRGVLATVFNSETAYTRWRQSISEKLLKEVEGTASCGPVFRQLSLTLFGSIERARNLDIPTFQGRFE